MEPSIVDEGIDAYKSGDKAEAVRLLTEAVRRDPKDENAWLWLGAALDDPTKRRQAFERVLQINPNNDKAKAALERLGGGGATGARPAGSARPAAGASGAATSESLKRAQQSAQKLASTAYSEGFKIPMQIEGAPERINGPYIMEHGRERATQGFNFYMNRDVQGYASNLENTTIWDIVFTVGVGALALALVIMVGRFIGFFVQLFRPGLGGFLMIFIAPILIIVAVAASFAAAVYAAQFFLKQQYNIDASVTQLGMSFALVLLPMLLVQAIFEFFAAALGTVFNIFPILIGLVLTFYAWYLLKDVYAKDYGADNDRNMYVAAIVVGVYIVIFGLIRIVFRV